MRILVLNNEYPPLGGGAGVISQKYAKGLQQLGHSVTVVSAWFKGEEEDSFDEDGVRLIRLRSKRKNEFKSGPLEFISWMLAAKKHISLLLQKESYDLSIANYLLPSGEVSRYLKTKFDLPYVVVSHGHDVPFAFPKQMLKFHLVSYFKLKSIAKNAELFFHQSSEMKNRADKFLGKGMASKNVIVPNGCDTAAFYPDQNKKNKVLKILFVGRLVEQKDPWSFLEAILLFSKTNIPFEVKVHGDGPLKGKMEKFVQDNALESFFEFTGWITKKKLLSSYQSAHTQIISSVFEGMSITVLEALASGLYLITTPVSGNPDVVEEGENGTFVDFRKPEEICSKLVAFEKLRAEKSQVVESEYLNRFREKYDWKQIVEQYNKFLIPLVK